MPIPLAAAIPAAASVVGGAISAISGSGKQKRAQRHEIDMWNRQNAYNTPAEQMKRFKEAGLNPNLMYGQGSSGNANSKPQTIQQDQHDWGKTMSSSGMAALQGIQQNNDKKRSDDLARSTIAVNDANILKTLADTDDKMLTQEGRLEWQRLQNTAQRNTNSLHDTRKDVLEQTLREKNINNNRKEEELLDYINDRGNRDKKSSLQIKEQTQRIRNLKADETYKNAVNKLAKHGLTLTNNEWSNLYYQITENDETMAKAKKLLKTIGTGTKDAAKAALNALKNFINPFK